MKKIHLITAWLLLVYVTSFAQNKNAFPVQVTVENGVIEGDYDTKTGIQTYFGVPFAKPPVGELRWKAPQPLQNWEGVKETKQFSARPMQKLIWGDMNSRSNGVSEDCLYLNVWTPAKRNTKDLPVLLYFYGGGNVAGDASEPRYDGESMAKKGIIVVTCNYRLNVFGNFAHPGLSAEASYKASGNYGYLDQVAGMKWVHQNIAKFGGDPKKVTIAGESAGSISVSYQMASPLAKDLIAGAIGESGAGIGPTMSPVPLVEAEKVGQEFATKAGVSSLKELRNLSARDLYEMYDESGRFGFPVVLDGYFLPKYLPEIFAAKKQAQIPLLVGWNSAENPAGAFMQGMPNTPENFISRVTADYPVASAEVLELYPHSTEEEVIFSATDMASARFITYATWKWSDLHAKNSTQPVYRYFYTKLRPPLVDNSMVAGLAGGTLKKDENAPEPLKVVGAPHACEIEYCMGNLRLVKEFAWTADDYKVSATMSDYFANFIKTGNPNGEKLPVWPAVNQTTNQPDIMIIDVESKAVKAQNDARFRFLDKIYNK